MVFLFSPIQSLLPLLKRQYLLHLQSHLYAVLCEITRVLTGQQRGCSAWQHLQTRPSEASDPPAYPTHKTHHVLQLEHNCLFPSI